MARRIKWSESSFIDQAKSVCLIDEAEHWRWNYESFRDHDCNTFPHAHYPSVMINGKNESVARRILKSKTGRTGKVARHTCDIWCCCNPDHLLWGTHADNVYDQISRGRHASQRGTLVVPDNNGENHWTHRFPEKVKRGSEHWATGKPNPKLMGDNNPSRIHPENLARGESHGRAKLTTEIVQQIRTDHLNGTTMYRLSKIYGVSKRTISQVVKRKTWTHI